MINLDEYVFLIFSELVLFYLLSSMKR